MKQTCSDSHNSSIENYDWDFVSPMKITNWQCHGELSLNNTVHVYWITITPVSCVITLVFCYSLFLSQVGCPQKTEDRTLGEACWCLDSLLFFARRLARLDSPGGDSPIHIIGEPSVSESELDLESSESSPIWKCGDSSDIQPPIWNTAGPFASEMDKWRRMRRLTAMAFSAKASSSRTLLVLQVNNTNHYICNIRNVFTCCYYKCSQYV